LFDLCTSRRPGPPRERRAYVRDVSFAPDGKSLAVGHHNSTILFREVPRPRRPPALVVPGP
jgi:hypothetical protein